MTQAYLLLLVVLLLLCSVGPGLFFIRRLGWEPGETLCGSVAASMVFVYLGSFAIFIFIPPANLALTMAAHWGLSGVCAAMTIACWRDLRRLWSSKSVRQMLLVLAAVWVWCFIALSMIRSYGGGRWSGDWLEHYQRSIFFLTHTDLTYRFLDLYLLTERPPLMNVVAAHFLAQTDTGFDMYQLVAISLNVLPALPLYLFARSVGGKRFGKSAGGAIALAAILAASPMFVQNVTFVWTKPFSGFFVILMLWLYLRGWMRREKSKMVAAFACGAAGCLAHFSAVSYVLVLAAHYVLMVWWQRQNRWREIGAIIVISGALLATWFNWAMANFGFRKTFMSNLVAIDMATRSGGGHLHEIATNVYTTIVPYFVRSVPYRDLNQEDSLGRIRDLIFSLYQCNAIFALGSTGAAVLLYLWFTRRVGMPRRLRRFWMCYVPLSGLLAIAVVPYPEAWGAAHVSVQPLILLGLAMVAGSFARLPTGWRWVVCAGLMIDFVGGVLLQLHFENRVFQIIKLHNGTFTLADNAPSLSHASQYNFFMKDRLGLNFWGDGIALPLVAMEILLCCGMGILLWRMMKLSGAGMKRGMARGYRALPAVKS